ncbi:TIR domain-containing protein [Verrucomicrobia bacterium]|nr:TIR domain-containing protein [Verrucomicrobiota bacterium]
MSAEVFVSYASEDRERILDLVENLRGAGVSVWIDQMGIEGATMWSQEIVEAIDGCKVLILAISQQSTESENVVKELALASERRKKILPVCLESSGIPKSMEYQLAGIQRVEYFAEEKEQGLQAMIRSLAKLGVTVSDEASEEAAKAPGFVSHGPSHHTGSTGVKRESTVWLKVVAGVAILAVLGLAGALIMDSSPAPAPGPFVLGQAQTNTTEQMQPLAKPVTLDTNRVVVLPFKVIGASKESEDLGYGLVSTLTSKLQPLDNLTVIANESALKFKDSTQSPNEIGQALRVGTIVTGTIQTGGDKVQISIRAINSNSEEVNWSGVFDNEINQFIDLQNEIATELATELKGGLAAAETQQLAQKATTKPEAQEQYLAGRREWNKRTFKGFENAIKHFEKAIELDAGYADPYVGLSDAYSLMVYYNYATRNEAIPKSKQYAETAKDKNPNLAKAYTSTGWILHMFERDWSGAEENYKKAIELNPNYATSRQWYALYLINVGRKKEALEMVIKAEQLDPTSMIIKSVLGLQYQGVGEEELALKFSNEALKMSPLFGGALRTKYILLDTEDIDEGIAKYQEALKINKNPIDPRMGLLRLHLKKGDQRAALNEFAEIIGYPKVTIEQCGIVAQMYYYLGKKEIAYHWLEKAMANQERVATEMAAATEFVEWQKEPRFRQMYKKINHPMYVDK